MAPIFDSWSFSSLTEYEQCPYRVELKRKFPIKDRHPAAQRGIDVHENAQAFIEGKAELGSELSRFAEEFKAVKALYRKKQVRVEEEWAYDRNLEPTEWKSPKAWMRLKLDLLVLKNPEHIVIDLKTGRRYGNEVKHASQTLFYAGVTFLRYPKLPSARVELWYPDQDELVATRVTRTQGMHALRQFCERGERLTSARFFPAKPSSYTCRFCPYRLEEAGGNGKCIYTVSPLKRQ